MTDSSTPPLVDIVYYTDPLCCWSWALEPQWRRLLAEYGARIRWRYRMGGLIENWNRFSDPMNAVSRPVQMGPLWMQARHVSGMPIAETLWVNDPPSSSYPACLAVKAAEQQSPQAGAWYLRRLREAVMVDGRNIGRRATLLEVAQTLAADAPDVLDADCFEADLDADAAAYAFREDLRDVRYRAIARFPTITFRPREGRGVMTVGYRPYEALRTALEQVAADLHPAPPDDGTALAFPPGRITERERLELEGAPRAFAEGT